MEASSGARVVLKAVPAEARRGAEHAFAVLRRSGSPALPAPRALVAGEGSSPTWLVTGFVEGEALERGPVSVAEAVRDGLAVAHALAALHRAGTHHGDVSPANVVRDAEGQRTLVDLGQLGRCGSGTPGFLAPEVLAGGGGPAADRFSLGCLLCWRLFGEVPWTRPEALVRVRSLAQVELRLRAMGLDTLTQPLADLVLRLLHPDPAGRPEHTEDVVRRLRAIDARWDEGGAAGQLWSIPSRWPYRGVDLDEVVARWPGDPPRLVAVEGPPGSGRTRVVEEIVQELQQRGVVARLVDPERIGRSWGRDYANWLEGWMAAPREGGVLGIGGAATWPENLGGQVDVQASVLWTAAAWAECTLVLPVSPELGASLAQRSAADPGQGFARVVLRPWSAEELREAIERVSLGDESTATWAGALRSTTGGWPAAVVRALHACAELGVASAADLARAVAQRGADVFPLDDATADAVLRAHWRLADPGATLPAHVHDGHAPLPIAVAAAQQRLGSAEVVRRARAALAAIAEPSLALAVDARDPAAVDRVLASIDAIRRSEPGAGALVEWLATSGTTEVGARGRVLVARCLLRQGRAEAALAVVEGVPDDAARVEAARALQRLGRAEDALARLEGVDDAAAHGLRWRLWVDRGEARRAVEACAVAELEGLAAGRATAWLWGGYAAVVLGDAGRALPWLEAAVAAIEGRDDLEAWAIRARAIQLLGNLAHARGELRAALDAYAQATEAFVAAEETIGALLVRGSIASLAIPCSDLERGLVHGRAAVRGLLAVGQLDALPEAVLNLVQLLLRVDARDEARLLVERTQALLAATASDVGRARLQRAHADVVAAAQRRLAPGDAREAEWAYAQAARALERAGAQRDAADTWIRAATWARAERRLVAAQLYLSHARTAAAACEDLHSRVSTAIEATWQAIATGPEATEAALRTLAATATSDDVLRHDELELAWQIDRVTWAALRSLHPLGAPPRSAVARRLLTTLETIMNRISPLDRDAALAVISSEAEPTGPILQALLAETAEPGTAAPAVSASEESRTQRLLRMYRRFAREDRLDVLLEQVVDAVLELTEAERGAVVVRGAADERFEVTRELADGSEGVKFSRSVIDRVLETGEPVMSVDAAADERFDGSRSISHLNLRSVLAVPLRFRGSILGAIYVDHRLRRGNFDEADLAVVEAFAELAALAVAHARALADVRAQAEQLEHQGQELAQLLAAREAEVAELRHEVLGVAGKPYRGIVGSSAPMQNVFRLIERIAASDVPVVVYGESGTGKELVARAIHDASRRCQGPFVAENCGAVPETLLESVLFGHAKGAFTGAQAAKMGLFEAAHGGTIFLDEVSEMSPAMQTKLLRVLQEGELRRVGETQARTVDVRVIAASNRDLERMIQQGRFRQDLYYRINVVKITLPALRERTEDIPALIAHFVARHGGSTPELTAAARRALAAYAWPGNVRELENEVQRWLALTDGRVGVEDLSANIGRVEPSLDPDDLRIRPRVDRLERELIQRALERTGGNQTRAAELLGLSRYGLQKKLKRLDEEGEPVAWVD